MPAVVAAGGGASVRKSGLQVLVQSPPARKSCDTVFAKASIPFIEPAPANTYQIVNQVGTQVIHLGSGVYSVEKIAGASGYNADAISTVGITGDFVLRMKALTFTSSNYYGGGMNTDPTLDQNYNSVDWLILNAPSLNRWDIYEDGAITNTGFATNADYVWIWRVGSALYHGHGATLAAAQAAPDKTSSDSSTLYFDSAFTDLGDRLEVLLYEPGVAPTVYTLEATGAAVYTIIGQDAILRATRRLTASAAAAYVLTGQSAALKAQRRLAANAAASYALTGQSAILKAARKLTATGAASYSITGQNATLFKVKTFVAQLGTYTINGQSAVLRAVRVLSASAAAAYVLTGQSAGLRRSYVFTAQLGVYTITGQSAALKAQRRLALTPGSYALTGLSAALRKTYRLQAQTASYIITGKTAILAYSGVGGGVVVSSVRVAAAFFR